MCGSMIIPTGYTKTADKMHHCNVEEILHFTCSVCHAWWSVGTMERARPRKIHCPHCGEFNKTIYDELPHMNIVKDTKTVKGRGVFAHRGYRENDVVEVSPVVVTLGRMQDLPPSIAVRAFDWADVESEPSTAFALGHGSLFNHSDSANMRYESQYDKNQITFTAVRDIAVGEELTINYNSNGEPTWHDSNWFIRTGIKPI